MVTRGSLRSARCASTSSLPARGLSAAGTEVLNKIRPPASLAGSGSERSAGRGGIEARARRAVSIAGTLRPDGRVTAARGTALRRRCRLVARCKFACYMWEGYRRHTGPEFACYMCYLKVVNYRPQALCNLHSGSYDRGHGATTLHSPHQARTRRDRNLATEPPQGISSSSSRISRRLESSRRSSRSSCCTSKA